MNAKIDQNDKPTAIGTSSVDLITPVPLAVDPITGYLLVSVVDSTSAISPVLRSDAKIDENGKETMLGWNGTSPQAMITHNGYLAISF
jgi:hypothetical protein